MGFRGMSPSVWRWRGSSGSVLGTLWVGVLLLRLSLAQSVPPHSVCPAATAPHSLPEPHYQPQAQDQEPLSGFMSPVVQSFLNTVQPKPFPEELILKVAREQQQFDKDLITEVLLYEVGFLVCVAIGVLYIVLMPIVGFFLACCRCCDNCGGKMYQEQTSSIHCRRRALYWSAFVTTVVILAGNICMFTSNENFKVIVAQSPAQLNTTMSNVNKYLTTVPREVDNVVTESYKTVQVVTRNLDAIGPQLGTEIQKGFRGTMDPALNSVRLLDKDTKNTSVQLSTLSSSLAQLQSSVSRLQANVTAVKNRIDRTLQEPNCLGCSAVRPELQRLDVDVSVTSPSLTELQSAVDEVVATDLTSKAKEGEEYFNSIPQVVTNGTKGVVQSSKDLLDDIKKQISRVTADIPLSALSNISGTLEQVQKEIDDAMPLYEKAEQIRYAVCLTLCCVVLLVVVCNLLGLVLGPAGLSARADPSERSCTADCGGTFFMMAAGFSFLFCWLFMVLVLLLFLLGGNMFTLLCRPWDNGQLLKFVDTPGLIPGLEIGPSLGLKSNINISDIYSDCQENQPLWTTLHLYELINLDDLLNVSKYTHQIQQLFDNTDITLSTVTLLSPEVKQKLSSFSLTAQDMDSTTFSEQMNNVSRINLNTTADRLDELALLQPSVDIKNKLQDEANNLRQIQRGIETTIIPQLAPINSTIDSLRSVAQRINGTVGEVLSNVGAAQDFLNTNTTQIVKTESRRFLDCQLGYFIIFADWANLTITQQVGRCGPVAGAVDSVHSVVCSNMVESLNAYWFSLGWCMLFFIPGIIFSIKLAKYYRRMEYADRYDDHITMNHIPRAKYN